MGGGGVGSCGPSVGVGYESTDDLRDDLSRGTVEIADGRDGGVPGPKDGMAVGMLLMLGIGCANGPEEGARRAVSWIRTWTPEIPPNHALKFLERAWFDVELPLKARTHLGWA